MHIINFLITTRNDVSCLSKSLLDLKKKCFFYKNKTILKNIFVSLKKKESKMDYFDEENLFKSRRNLVSLKAVNRILV